MVGEERGRRPADQPGLAAGRRPGGDQGRPGRPPGRLRRPAGAAAGRPAAVGEAGAARPGAVHAAQRVQGRAGLGAHRARSGPTAPTARCTRCSATTGGRCCGWPTSGPWSSTCRSAGPAGGRAHRAGARPRPARGRRLRRRRGRRRCWSARALADAGLAGAVKTSGSKGLHVVVPVRGSSAEDVAAATRALAARTERLDPELATTAYIREDRQRPGVRRLDPLGAGTIVAAYSPRIRPGLPVSAPVGWDALADVRPGDVTVTDGGATCSATPTRGPRRCPNRSSCPPTWSPRATRSRSPGSRRCTRASAAARRRRRGRGR